MLPQVRHPPETLPTLRAGEVVSSGCVRCVGTLLQFGFFGWSRFVPSAVRSEIRRTVEDFIAFRTTVLHMDDSGAAMLGQTKSVLVEFSAQSANVVADVVFDFGEFRFRFLCNFDDVEGWIYVAFADY